MSKNVGVSEGTEWVRRRKVNEFVLQTDKMHRNVHTYHVQIGEAFDELGLPKNFSEFNRLAQSITWRIVFGSRDVVPEVFEIFNQANSILPTMGMEARIDDRVKKIYETTLRAALQNPVAGSLVGMSMGTDTEDELMHQIPHWIFPINGAIHTSLPRLLTVLGQSPRAFGQLVEELKKMPRIHDVRLLYQNKYLRVCILELLRLNNPVVTTFRTLLQDFEMNGKMYEKGDQFLILNNPVLRDQEVFDNPHAYIPERWSSELERSYSAIMFNQGPQRCPGKELVLFVIGSALVHYLSRANVFRDGTSVIRPIRDVDSENIPQMMNPCRLGFE